MREVVPYLGGERARMQVPRRHLFHWLAAGTALLNAAPVLACGELIAQAQTSPNPATAPEIYSFQLGGWPAYVIHDGTIPAPALQPFFLPEARPDELEKLLAEQFLTPRNWNLSLNVLVFRTPQGVVLVDSGMGVGVTPTTGRLKRGLEVLGISPTDVKAVVLSHAHPDHIGGTLNQAGQSVFPQARHFMARPEVDFWSAEHPDLSTTTLPDEIKKNGIATAHKLFQAAGDQLHPVDGEEEFWPGFRYLVAPGHTPGHRAVKITSGQDILLYLGDAVHIYAAQFLHPEWTMAADTSKAQAIASRIALLEQAANGRLRVAGGHLPFPGLGHVKKLAERQFAFVPQPWAV